MEKALERHKAFIGILFMKIKEKRKVKGNRLHVRRKMKENNGK